MRPGALLVKNKSIFALAGSFCLLLALYAGLFVMLTLANFLQHAGACTLAFEPLQSAFQGFILANTYLGHWLSLPSLNAPSDLKKDLSKIVRTL